MRIFVTGATGCVGSAVVKELLGSGYDVLGLARSDDAAASLSSVGAEVHRGSLEDLDSLRGGASAADGVIHTAFNTDFSKYAQSVEVERLAIEAIGETLVGSGRPLLVTSGVTSLAPGRVVTEDDIRPPVSSSFSRTAEALAFSFAERGVKTGVIRLPAVHGPDDHIFIPVLVAIARKKGESAYLDQGLNRCPTVHQLDAARVYRLALERNVAGAVYHAVAEEGVLFKDLAEAIGSRLNIPVVTKTVLEAKEHFGAFAMFAGLDSPASSKLTREWLGWEPRQSGLIADVAQSYP
jgi:nucleoside-diphosphate-sugar epimerase